MQNYNKLIVVYVAGSYKIKKSVANATLSGGGEKLRQPAVPNALLAALLVHAHKIFVKVFNSITAISNCVCPPTEGLLLK